MTLIAERLIVIFEELLWKRILAKCTDKTFGMHFSSVKGDQVSRDHLVAFTTHVVGEHIEMHVTIGFSVSATIPPSVQRTSSIGTDKAFRVIFDVVRLYEFVGDDFTTRGTLACSPRLDMLCTNHFFSLWIKSNANKSGLAYSALKAVNVIVVVVARHNFAKQTLSTLPTFVWSSFFDYFLGSRLFLLLHWCLCLPWAARRSWRRRAI